MSLGRLFQRFGAAEVTQDLPMWRCQNSRVDIGVTIVTTLFYTFHFSPPPLRYRQGIKIMGYHFDEILA